MKITVLGAGREVGKSAVLVEDKKKIVLDYGMKIQPEPPQFPIEKDIDAAVISHAHLDHVGGLPMLFRKKKIPAFMTDVGLELSTMLIKDSIKIAKKNKYPYTYGKTELKRMLGSTKIVNYGEKFKLGEFSCKLYDAGHVPGSAGVLLHNKKINKKVFYTGDVQTLESNLLNSCVLPKRVDTLIMECTYGQKLHPDKKKEMKKFLESVDEALANDARVLAPVFAVGRSQEIIMLLEKYADIVALDGMGRQACQIVSEYSAKVKNIKRFRRILDKITIVGDWKERELAAKKHPIIVSTAGMLSGGPVIKYLREIKDNPANKILFNGFLIPGTPGHRLIETKKFDNDEEKFDVKCGIEQFDLSAHTDRKGLFEIIQKTKPEQVLCVHGDKCVKFAKDIKMEFDIEAFAPKNGEIVRV